jgi:hypothetical protein
MNDWLNCDRGDPGYHIMTDDKIVGNLRSEEVTADENEDDIDEEEEIVPSHSDAYQVFGLSYNLDGAAGGMQLLQVKQIHDLAAGRQILATKQQTILDFIN